MCDVTIYSNTKLFHQFKNTRLRVGLELTSPAWESCALTSRAPLLVTQVLIEARTINRQSFIVHWKESLAYFTLLIILWNGTYEFLSIFPPLWDKYLFLSEGQGIFILITVSKVITARGQRDSDREPNSAGRWWRQDGISRLENLDFEINRWTDLKFWIF